jgi:hypothetical protein
MSDKLEINTPFHLNLTEIEKQVLRPALAAYIGRLSNSHQNGYEYMDGSYFTITDKIEAGAKLLALM